MAGEFTNDVRMVIDARAGGLCEICRVAPVEQFHHRRARGMGGTKRRATALPSNGLGLCAQCHYWVEANRRESLRLGYLCRQEQEPSAVAVLLDGRFVFLTDTGDYEDPPEEAD